MALIKRKKSAVITALLNQEDDYEIRSKKRRLWSKEWLRKREKFSHMMLLKELKENNPDFSKLFPKRSSK